MAINKHDRGAEQGSAEKQLHLVVRALTTWIMFLQSIEFVTAAHYAIFNYDYIIEYISEICLPFLGGAHFAASREGDQQCKVVHPKRLEVTG